MRRSTAVPLDAAGAACEGSFRLVDALQRRLLDHLLNWTVEDRLAYEALDRVVTSYGNHHCGGARCSWSAGAGRDR